MRLAMTAPFDRSPIDEIATAQKTFFIGFKIHNEPRNDDSSRPTPSSTSLRGAVKNVNRLDKFLRRRGNLFRLSHHSPIDEIATAQKTFFFGSRFIMRLAMTTVPDRHHLARHCEKPGKMPIV